MFESGKIFGGQIVLSPCCGCDPLLTHPSHFPWLDFQCLSIQRNNHHMISNQQQNSHCAPTPPFSLFLSYFLLLPFSYSPLQLSHPPSEGLEGVSGSQWLLFPSSSLLFLLSLLRSLSVRPSERFMWRLEAAQHRWADGLSHDCETDSWKWRYTSPEQNTLISKGVIMMWVRVLRRNRSKMSLSTFQLYV